MIGPFFGEYRWLSNFWPCDIVVDGIKYPSSEHAYQAAKTIDVSERMRIALLPKPGQAKRSGKQITVRSDWEQVKLAEMEKCLRAKFLWHHDLGQKLLSTGNEELVEVNTWGDRFWGVCDGRGENNLGKLLMKIREELK